MSGNEKAATTGDGHGAKGVAGETVHYPEEQARIQRAVILEYLRRMGHSILTRRDPAQRCARYVLPPGGRGHAVDG